MFYFTALCSASEAGSYSKLVDFVYHSALGLSVMKKKKGRLRCGGGTWRPASKKLLYTPGLPIIRIFTCTGVPRS